MVSLNYEPPPCRREAWWRGLRVRCAAVIGHKGSHVGSDQETREPVFWGRF
jgi:hypothetical protein